MLFYWFFSIVFLAEATIVHTASPQAKLPATKTAVVAPAVGTSSMLQGQGHPGSSQAPRPITATLFPTVKNATALMPNTALSASGMIAPNNAFPIVSASDTDGTTIAHQPPRKKAPVGTTHPASVTSSPHPGPLVSKPPAPTKTVHNDILLRSLPHSPLAHYF